MSGIHVTRGADNGAAIDALASTLAADGGGRVGIHGVYDDLSLRLRPSLAPHPRLLGRKVARAFTWEAADRRDRVWWPQGISTSAETGFAERAGHDVLVTSWYAKNGAGSRISLVDLDRRRYAHVLLVTATVDDAGRTGIAPLEVHAGGIVWHGPHLHIAATARGFHTALMSDVMRVPAGSELATRGHRYLLPIRLSHRGTAAAATDGAREPERLRFSFLTLDRSGTAPVLVAGEYATGTKSRRLARFALDPRDGLPTSDAGVVDERGERQMQGVAIADSTTYLTSSRGPWGPGSVHVGSPGAFREHRFATPMGPEDLVWWPATGCLWSVSEHPRRRWIFAMRRDDLGA